jgi:hypothetical protein
MKSDNFENEERFSGEFQIVEDRLKGFCAHFAVVYSPAIASELQNDVSNFTFQCVFRT